MDEPYILISSPKDRIHFSSGSWADKRVNASTLNLQKEATLDVMSPACGGHGNDLSQ